MLQYQPVLVSSVTVLVALISAATTTTVSAATLHDAVWLGGNGDWSAAANWSTGVAPHNTSADAYEVFIDQGNAAPSTVTLGASQTTVNSLRIDAGDRLAIGATGRLTVTNGGLTNAGEIVGASGVVFDLAGTYTTAGLGAVINNGGTLRLAGNLINTGNTFTNGQSDGTWQLTGRITGGTVNTLPGADLLLPTYFAGAGGLRTSTFDGVVLNGNVRMTSNNGSVTQLAIPNGITGTGTIFMDHALTALVANNDGTSVGSLPMTIGEGITVRGDGNFAAATTITNHGTIRADAGKSIGFEVYFAVDPAVPAVVSDGTFVLEAGSFFDTGGPTKFADGGRLEIDLTATSQALFRSTKLDLSAEEYLDLNHLSGAGPFLIANYTTLTGTFDHVTPGFTLDFSQPNRIYAVAVPEPGSLTLLLGGILALSTRRRRAADADKKRS